MNNEKALNWLYNNHPDFTWDMVDFSVSEKRGAYCIYDATTRLAYIGSCRNCKERFSRHRRQLRLSKHHNKKLQSAFLSCNDIRFFAIAYTENFDTAKFYESHWATVFGFERLMNSIGVSTYAVTDRSSDECISFVQRLGYDKDSSISWLTRDVRYLGFSKNNPAIEAARKLIL